MIQGSNSHKQAVEGSSPAKQDWLKYLNPITAANKVADLIKGTDESKTESKAEPNTYQANKRHEKKKNKMIIFLFIYIFKFKKRQLFRFLEF